MNGIRKDAKRSLLLVLLLIFFGIVLVLNQENFILFAIKFLGYLSILVGIIILFYILVFKKEKVFNISFGKGLLFLLYGVLVIVNCDVLLSVLTILLGVFLLYEASSRLDVSFSLKKKGFKYWVYLLVFSLTQVVLGMLMFFKPVMKDVNESVYLAILLFLSQGLMFMGSMLIILFGKEKALDK